MFNFKMFHTKFAEFMLRILGTPRVTRTIRRQHRKIGRNGACPCGRHEPVPFLEHDGVTRPKKYKNCHWAQDEARGVR